MCASVRYEISGEFGPAIFCHCRQCRKATGTSFATNASVRSEDFRFVAGEDLVSQFESSPGEYRRFCSQCGSPLVKTFRDDPDQTRIRLGTLDDDPGIQIAAHIFVAYKAPWMRITDDIP